MGRSIIVSAVTYGLGFLGQEKHFHETFQQYVSDKLVNPEVESPSFWIAVSDTALLALKQLFECVFAPYITKLLIAQDLAVDEEEAFIVRERSKVYGELIIGGNTEDGLLDNIIQSIIHPWANLEASLCNCCDLILIVMSYNVHLGHQFLEYDSSSGLYKT
jgi:hypothetical protein